MKSTSGQLPPSDMLYIKIREVLVTKYRYVQFSKAVKGTLKAGINLNASGYHDSQTSLELSGWVVDRHNQIDSVAVYIYSATRREHLVIDSFKNSPGIANKFPEYPGIESCRFTFELNSDFFPELEQGRDFAIEMVANTKAEACSFKTIVFVQDDQQQNVVFVVGSPRSGTSILGNTLSHVLLDTRNFNEGHVLPLLPQLNSTLSNYFMNNAAASLKGMMLNETNQYLLTCQMHSVVKNHYQSVYPSDWLVEKTPGGPMLASVPFLKQLWPQAHIVFAKRRGIENINSRLRKFPNTSFENHCKQWADAMTRWSNVKKGLTNCIEVDQYDIENQASSVAKSLATFLGLTEVQETKILQEFETKRPERTRSQSETGPLSLSETDWTPEQKKSFQSICSAVMQNYGYSESESYYA